MRAHPRSRGDHWMPHLSEKALVGSSPLARGPLSQVTVGKACIRLIPARAGTTVDYANRTAARRAHPRSRGDHVNTIFRACKVPGSSPLARGPLAGRRTRERIFELIPARAGTTETPKPKGSPKWAHPRSRGDH